MKELSIEQKAQRYDEALKAAIVAHKDEDRHLKATLERIFPELKESEDERIRKEILDCFKTMKQQGCFPSKHKEQYESWIAWLEKQGEHINFRNKIQIGDKVTRNEDGVLVNLSQLNRVAKKQDEQKSVFKMITPEESLGIDSDTYNKIVDECIYGEQNPAWSEEDEKCLKELIQFFENLLDCVATEERHQENRRWLKFLKSLKETNIMQLLQKWSIEDNIRLQEAIRIVQNYHNNIKDEHLFATSGWCLGWLKSLKDRYTWKPSDEQMKCLDNVKGSDDHNGYVLNTLYNDLKKLKG